MENLWLYLTFTKYLPNLNFQSLSFIFKGDWFKMLCYIFLTKVVDRIKTFMKASVLLSWEILIVCGKTTRYHVVAKVPRVAKKRNKKWAEIISEGWFYLYKPLLSQNFYLAKIQSLKSSFKNDYTPLQKGLLLLGTVSIF